MTFKDFMVIYEVLGKIVEEMKEEENTIKELYNNNIDKYEKDEAYNKIYIKRVQLQNICENIEDMEV